MMVSMGCLVNLNSSGTAWSIMEDAAPKKFVLFVQPEPLRRIRFMELYRSGLVAQWVKDIAEARKALTRIFDVVVVDLNFEPEHALAFSRDVKENNPARIVIGLGAPALAPDPGLDLWVPPGTSAGELIRLLGSLRIFTEDSSG
jgi:hypothetical protein